MIERIEPLVGWVYSEEDVTKTIAPPYDVISEEQAAKLLERSPHNVRRLILPLPGERADWHGRAASTLGEWVGRGVLREAKEAFYVCEQEWNGTKRLALWAGVRLDPFGQGVYPHENTLAAPKEDRYRLLKQTGAQFSPVFFIVKDESRSFFEMLAAASAPVVCWGKGDDGCTNRLKLVETAAAERLVRFLESAELYIADGHHRYSSALRLSQEGGRKHVFGGIVSSADEGLVIHPYHRVFPDLELDRATAVEKLAARFAIEAPEVTSGRLVLRTPRWSIGLRPTDEARRGLADLPETIARLDVSVVERLLRPILAELAGKELRVKYTPWESETRSAVAVLVNPVKLSELMAAARAGICLPPKSTYFFPKFPSGLIVSRAR